MRDLLEHIGCSPEEIEEILSIVKKLEHVHLLEEIKTMAEHVMAVHPCQSSLLQHIELVHRLEERAGVHKYSLELCLLLFCALLLKEDYLRDGMSLELYYESMKDLRYKLQECKDVYGVVGNFVGFWYDGFFDRTRFALGRLQFELMPVSISEPLLLDGRLIGCDDKAINMHVPSSGPLVPEEVTMSFSLAKDFFADHFVGKSVVFQIDSWLLDQDLVALLPEGNLKVFVDHFHALRTVKHDQFYDGWRVFGKYWGAGYEQLPETTRLQKAIKDYLQRGGMLGEGYGLMVW